MPTAHLHRELSRSNSQKEEYPHCRDISFQIYDDFKQVLKVDAFAKMCTKLVIDYFNKVDQVWTVSRGTADTLREYGYKGSIEIVPNGSDFVVPENMDSLITQTEEKLNLKKDDLVFLLWGRYMAEEY